MRNFGFLSTFVNRCAIPPKSCSALFRAAGIVGPKAGPASRHAARKMRSTASREPVRAFKALLYVWSGGMAQVLRVSREESSTPKAACGTPGRCRLLLLHAVAVGEANHRSGNRAAFVSGDPAVRYRRSVDSRGL